MKAWELPFGHCNCDVTLWWTHLCFPAWLLFGYLANTTQIAVLKWIWIAINVLLLAGIVLATVLFVFSKPFREKVREGSKSVFASVPKTLVIELDDESLSFHSTIDGNKEMFSRHRIKLDDVWAFKVREKVAYAIRKHTYQKVMVIPIESFDKTEDWREFLFELQRRGIRVILSAEGGTLVNSIS